MYSKLRAFISTDPNISGINKHQPYSCFKERPWKWSIIFEQHPSQGSENQKKTPRLRIIKYHTMAIRLHLAQRKSTGGCYVWDVGTMVAII